MTENRDNYIRTYRKTEMGNTLMAGKDMTLSAGGNLSARSSIMASESGKVTLAAGDDVTLSNGYNEAMDDYGLKYKEKGFLSGKTAAIKSHDEEKKASPAIISGDSVSILSGKDTRIAASQVIATHDVTAAAGGDIHISSAPEYESHDYEKQVKKRGLLSGGGLGFTLGSEKRKDRYDSESVEQVGSTIGSVEGNVRIGAGKDADIEASHVSAGKDLAISGKNVTITSKDNEYTNREEHEYKRSGLSVSLGGSTFNALSDVAAPVERAADVQDSRLRVLYGYDAYKNLDKRKETLQDLSKGKVHASLDIGFTNSSYAYHSVSQMTEGTASRIQAGETAALIAENDIHVHGSDMSSNEAVLLAGKDIILSASENRMSIKSSEKSSGFGITASIGPSGLAGINGYISHGSGQEKEQSVSYDDSNIRADHMVYLSGGNDIVLKGSQVRGKRIVADAGHDLTIESLQNKHTYDSENKGWYISGGRSVKYEPEGNQTVKKWGVSSVGAGHSSGTVHSDYAGVADQAGLYAETDGAAVSTKNKTSLKGGVIDSHGTPGKTRLSTGILEWEDIENHASYTSKGVGASYNYYSHFKEMSQKEKDEVNSKRGLTPQIPTGSKGKSSSATHSAVSQGNIVINKSDKQRQNLEKLERNPQNTLNRLGKIFDKKKVEEKQELAGLFGKLAYNEIHNMKDGPEKTAMHALVGGIMSRLTNGDFMAGAAAAAVNKMLMQEIKKASHGDPAKMQWMSAAIGGLVTQMLARNGQIGAGVASSATKNNSLKDFFKALNGTFNSNEEYQAIVPRSDDDGSEAANSGIDQEQGTVNVPDDDGTAANHVSYPAERLSNITNLDVTGLGQADTAGTDDRANDVDAGNYTQGSYAQSNNEDVNTADSNTDDSGSDSNSDSATGSTETHHKSASYKDALQRISDASKDEARDEVGNTFATYAMVNEMKKKFPGLPEDYLRTKVENAVKLGGYTTAAINYGYNVYENHQEFKSFNNALQADAWDTLPVSISLMSGIIGSAWLGTWGAMIGTVTLGGMMQMAVDQNKAEMKQSEMQNQNQEERNN